MLKRLLPLGLALVFAVGSLPAVETTEPPNLYTLKQQITAYVATGQYGKEVAKVAAEANAYLVKRIPKGIPRSAKTSKKLAVVFDIDETILSNVRHIQANDYGYIPKIWDTWVAEGQCTAIYPVQAVYQTAVNAKVDVFFITGRTEKDAPATERNLRQVGYETWSRIIYKPADFAESTRAFKIDVRRKLAAEGYLIILNMGDQDSDLLGGYSERIFKLPNPFYIVN
ncbi:HAD family acid phosphatase [Opitutus sp. GAS368]|jgi:predicted secreted acid phosphatase|uniref:HAD family acid phosphatase n=1 Tax=Opitutus sp. GAS368 TaxID=1882749 RepID=UPI0008798168|nr:HAD family acid phosphatase [Opitutus sp. GAS368]SDR75234.1 HAD superfamily, subfamily IIIB (Acid phosphatase) [Opitutus sp. GAS368]